METERDEHALLPFGERERRAARVERRTDRDDPLDTRLTRSDERLGHVAESVQVRVCVDHADSDSRGGVHPWKEGLGG